jgi:hypothetical protein
MVQISTAEQGELQRTAAKNVFLLNCEAKGAVIEQVEADQVIARSIMLADNPEMGWKVEEYGLGKEQAASLIGSLAMIRTTGPFVRAYINEIDQDNPENSVMHEYIGTQATLKFLAAG